MNDMDKLEKIGFVGFLSIVIVGAIVYWLVSPLFIDKKVNERLEDIAANAPKTENTDIPATESAAAAINRISTGDFIGLANHNASGTATLLEVSGAHYIRFEDNFSSTNGPDVRVYLGKDGTYDPETDLGPIKGNIGGQNYQIPDTIDTTQYNEVWLWCRAFSVPFGKAVLQ